jgi:3-oxoacyl-[acyl-carrier protein] reductase
MSLQMQQKFAGLTALVTGASSGIGADIALSTAQNGAYTLIHYNANKDGAEGVLAQLHSAGGDGECVCADLSKVSAIQEFAMFLDRLPRGVDILVNNAGSLIERKTFLEITESLWTQVFTLKLTSAFLVTQAVLPRMLERKSGCVVNVSSVAARFGGGLGSDRVFFRQGAINHDERLGTRIRSARYSCERSFARNHRYQLSQKVFHV